jgi:hypothetical protein
MVTGFIIAIRSLKEPLPATIKNVEAGCIWITIHMRGKNHDGLKGDMKMIKNVANQAESTCSIC